MNSAVRTEVSNLIIDDVLLLLMSGLLSSKTASVYKPCIASGIYIEFDGKRKQSKHSFT